MSLFATSSTHRVLQIPELLSAICHYLGPSDTLSNACVCKKWSNVALDALWQEVDDLYILVSLLAPLELKSGHSFRFTRAIEPGDWTRFARYAVRVRSLLRPRDLGRARHIHSEVFHEVARSRTTLEILPNLNTLEWDDGVDITFCVLFMGKNVKRFRVYLNDASPMRLPNGGSALFQSVTSRMPNLELLDISSHISMAAIEPEFARLITGLPKLREVEFPLYYTTPPITKALSRLTNLAVVGFQYDEDRGKGNSVDVDVPQAILDDGAFPALYDFSASMPFNYATKFFNQPFFPQHITMLFIDSARPESPSDFHDLLETIVKSCPLLQCLALNPCLGNSSKPPTDERISVDILRPIFRLPKLISFDINHHYPLDLKHKDIEELASKWPNLETLMLNSDPVALDHPPSLTLTALLPFAQHCPNLRRLGLYMDASPDDLPPIEDLKPFKTLDALSVGLSSIAEHDAISLFLSYMLPFDCYLECGGTWMELEWELSNPDSEYSMIQKTWTTVGSVLPLLQKVRMEERKRYEAGSKKDSAE